MADTQNKFTSVPDILARLPAKIEASPWYFEGRIFIDPPLLQALQQDEQGAALLAGYQEAFEVFEIRPNCLFFKKGKKNSS